MKPALFGGILGTLVCMAIILTTLMGDGKVVRLDPARTHSGSTATQVRSESNISNGAAVNGGANTHTNPSTNASTSDQDGRDAAIIVLSIFFAIAGGLFILRILYIFCRLRQHALSRVNNRARVNEMVADILRQWQSSTPEMRARLRMAVSTRDFTGEDYEMLRVLDEQNQVRGATEEQIGHLPLHRMTQQEIDETSDSMRQCSVCLAPFEVDEEIRTVMCMHKVSRWRERSASMNESQLS
jgi:hypothetical protein